MAPFPSLSQSGVIGGIHIGYNYQVSQFVFGLEGDVNGASTRDSSFSAGLKYGLRENIDASIRGRIGYAFDRVLIYGTGGGAYGSFHTAYNDGIAFDTFNDGRIGWTVGGGLEYAIDNNWSVRAEYRYTDYGHITDSPVFSDRLGSLATTSATTACRPVSRISSTCSRRRRRSSRSTEIGFRKSKNPALVAGFFRYAASRLDGSGPRRLRRRLRHGTAPP